MCLRNKIDHITADNQLNAKPVVKQRHPGDEFSVSQRGSTKALLGKQTPCKLSFLYTSQVKMTVRTEPKFG